MQYDGDVTSSVMTFITSSMKIYQLVEERRACARTHAGTQIYILTKESRIQMYAWSGSEPMVNRSSEANAVNDSSRNWIFSEEKHKPTLY
jgi:hypothetical protein